MSGSNLGPHVLDDPLALFLVQLMIILGISKLLGSLARRLKQPAVAAEMITGILLGPTVLGNIPGWTDTLFAPEKLSPINMCARLAIIFYMFIVGLELDIAELVRSGPKAFGTMLTAVVTGVIVSIPLAFIIDSGDYFLTSVPIFIFFYGLLMAIGDTPVIARLLSERRLIATSFGMFVMACVIADDVVVWPLLAVVTSLANSTHGNPIEALYIIPILVGNGLLVWFVVRPLLQFCCKRLRGDSLPPWFFFSVVFILFTFCASTEITGLTEVLGALEVGMVMPRSDPRLIHRIIDKLQDLTVVILLPLFFATSGLKTNMLLLDTIRDWGLVLFIWVLAILSMASGPGGITSLSWPKNRALALGIVLSAKGLSGVIALNLGIDTGIITPKFFAMASVMVLGTTVGVVPLAGGILPEGERPEEVQLEANETAGGKRVVVCLEELNEGLDLVSAARYVCGAADAILGLRFMTTHERLSDFTASHPDNTVAQVCADRAQLLGLNMTTQNLLDSDPTVDDVANILKHDPALVLINVQPVRDEPLVTDLIERSHTVLVAGFVARETPEGARASVLMGLNGDLAMSDVAKWIADAQFALSFMPLDDSPITLDQMAALEKDGLGTAIPRTDTTVQHAVALCRVGNTCSMVVIPAAPDDVQPSLRSAITETVLSACHAPVLMIFHGLNRASITMSTHLPAAPVPDELSPTSATDMHAIAILDAPRPDHEMDAMSTTSSFEARPSSGRLSTNAPRVRGLSVSHPMGVSMRQI